MKRPAVIIIGLLVGLLALPARAVTPMLTASGATGNTTSSCPTGTTGNCSSGWFKVGGSFIAFLTIDAASSSSAIVTVKYRSNSSGITKTLKTITNPASTDIGYYLPGAGEVSIDVSSYVSGTIYATLEAYTYTGGVLW